MITVLGIETSCDETSAAVVCDSNTLAERIKSHVLVTQIEEHTLYGGVVPELAARAHLRHIENVVNKALDDAQLSLQDIDAIAVTAGPGLIGGVLVGVNVAKAMAMMAQKPLIAVNHLEGHALTVRLTHQTPFPFLLLLASGGHCQFIAVNGLGSYRTYGRTLDDSAGEAFDKVAKMMGLGYPGGPIIEKLAKTGDENRFTLPRPLITRSDAMMSFSGLKTAMRLLIEQHDLTQDSVKEDLAASFQKTVADHLCNKLKRAIEQLAHPVPSLVVAGGVAANLYLRSRLQTASQKYGMEFVAPPLHLCTDNGAMIAWAGLERYKAMLANGSVDLTMQRLKIAPKARWPLDELSL